MWDATTPAANGSTRLTPAPWPLCQHHGSPGPRASPSPFARRGALRAPSTEIRYHRAPTPSSPKRVDTLQWAC